MPRRTRQPRLTPEVAAPYRITDRRSSSGYNNQLFESATGTHQRKTPTSLDKGINDTITPTGRRQLLQYGRWLYANFPQVHGMVLEQANLACSFFIPQFYGLNRAWGDAAESWLYEWHKIMDFRGWPFCWETWTQGIVAAALREGDLGTVLVDSGGYPFVQTIPSHRIGSMTGIRNVADATSRWDGFKIRDGVIINDYAQAVAYRVYDESVSAAGSYVDVPAANFVLTFWPEWPDQLRGIPALASGVNYFMDIKQTRANEMVAQAAASSVALLETNETGEVDTAKSVIKTAATLDSSDNKATHDYEELEGGTIRYFRANTGCDLKAFSYDRPGANAMQFLEVCMRDAFSSSEWDYFFSLDPSKVGGASMRVVVERINRVLAKRRAMVEQAARRVDGWAIAKAIKAGLLPASDEWWKWTYQGPKDVTADRKYDSDVDIQEINARIGTLKGACSRRGEYWEEVQDQWLLEQKRLQDKAKEMGVELAQAEPPETIPNRTRREVVNEDETKEKDQNQEDEQ